MEVCAEAEKCPDDIHRLADLVNCNRAFGVTINAFYMLDDSMVMIVSGMRGPEIVLDPGDANFQISRDGPAYSNFVNALYTELPGLVMTS